MLYKNYNGIQENYHLNVLLWFLHHLCQNIKFCIETIVTVIISTYGVRKNLVLKFCEIELYLNLNKNINKNEAEFIVCHLAITIKKILTG